MQTLVFGNGVVLGLAIHSVYQALAREQHEAAQAPMELLGPAANMAGSRAHHGHRGRSLSRVHLRFRSDLLGLDFCYKVRYNSVL